MSERTVEIPAPPELADRVCALRVTVPEGVEVDEAMTAGLTGAFRAAHKEGTWPLVLVATEGFEFEWVLPA